MAFWSQVFAKIIMGQQQNCENGSAAVFLYTLY